MNDSTKSNQSKKSPLVFLLLMGILVVATLVAASEFFLRPQMESALKDKITIASSQARSFNISKQPDEAIKNYLEFNKSTSND